MVPIIFIWSIIFIHLNQKTSHFFVEKKFHFEFITSSSSFHVLEICLSVGRVLIIFLININVKVIYNNNNICKEKTVYFLNSYFLWCTGKPYIKCFYEYQRLKVISAIFSYLANRKALSKLWEKFYLTRSYCSEIFNILLPSCSLSSPAGHYRIALDKNFKIHMSKQEFQNTNCWISWAVVKVWY